MDHIDQKLQTSARPLAFLFLGRTFLKFSMVLSIYHHLQLLQSRPLLTPMMYKPGGGPVVRKKVSEPLVVGCVL